ncbi:RES family NAD+ phosphorylase [Enterococcus thailandicus]|uniref:RES family NAD+ phosphorylase n=2 Tax=Enterococcus TaxID=1350 RepID=UPI002892EF34|nr:RES family NAD+ phosphorylase [Enterococcus thailandicus]
MIFCEDCFKDREVVSMIQSLNNKGNCELVSSHRDVLICNSEDTDTLDSIRIFINQILDLYTVESKLSQDFPKNKKYLLKDSLEKKWSVFNINSEKIDELLEYLFEDDSSIEEDIFNEKVGILAEYDVSYADKFILKDNDWSKFVETITYGNRYHTNTINLNLLKKFIGYKQMVIKCSDRKKYYRGRVSLEEEYTKNDMYSPPKGKASAGRLNPEGISVLYLTDKEQACYQEIRASFNDSVYIGEFELTRDVKIVDFRNFEYISLNSEVDALEYYLNRDILKEISNNLSIPTTGSSKSKDYIPLQYISDYIKSLDEKFDGIMYKSVMNEGASNLMLFENDAVSCINVENKRIRKIIYDV